MRSAIAAVAACLMFGAAQAATAVWSTADVAATSTTVTPSYGANTSHTIGLAFLLPAGGTNAVVGAGQQVNFPGGGGTSPNNNTLQVYFADGTATLKVQGNGTANTASFTLGENLEAGSRHGLVYSLQRGANERFCGHRHAVFIAARHFPKSRHPGVMRKEKRIHALRIHIGKELVRVLRHRIRVGKTRVPSVTMPATLVYLHNMR